MELIVDFILLAVSGAAVFYCLILSKKLEGLRDTEKGLGATIATMSATVDQARAAVMIAKESSAKSIAELTPLIEETREILPKLEEMIDVISELSDIAVNDINESASSASAKLEETIGAARKLRKILAHTAQELNAGAGANGRRAPRSGQVVDLDEISSRPAGERAAPAASRVDGAIKKARSAQRAKQAAV